MKKYFFLLFVIIFSLFFSSLIVSAQNNQHIDSDVIEAYSKYKSRKRLTADEEYYLAEVFLEGYFGESFNPKKYLSLLNSAANRGSKEARYDIETGYPFANLANVYFDLDNYKLTRYYAEKAIELSGDYRGLSGIGVVCANRSYNAILEDNYQTAYLYARLGADMGDYSALANLAICYTGGYGVTKDIDKAYALMKIAKDHNYGFWTRNELSDKYDYLYDTLERHVNRTRLSKIQTAQNNAERNLNRTATSNSSERLRTVVALGCVIAGIVAICDAIDLPSPSSSSSSSSSYSSGTSSYYSSLSASNSVSICPDCSGRGMMNCVWCYGSGVQKGGWFSSDEICWHCDGAGKTWCWHCNGKGSR